MNSIPKEWSVIKIPNLVDPNLLKCDVPWERGQINYVKNGEVIFHKEEKQVNGSLSRYNYPRYKECHYDIKNKLESILQDKLYTTYYFDRFYFKGNDLKKHRDRGACEISVTVHISNNLDYDWPIYFENPITGEPIEITCSPGDGVLYKGCDLYHWRNPMKGDYKSYFHQIFFHYVRANGHCLQFAFDQNNKVY